MRNLLSLLIRNVSQSVTGFYTENKNRIRLYAFLIFVAWAGTWYTYRYAIDFSAIPITFLYLMIYLAFFEFYDRKILTEISTVDELKKGNIAVAIFYLAIAVLLLSVAILVG